MIAHRWRNFENVTENKAILYNILWVCVGMCVCDMMVIPYLKDFVTFFFFNYFSFKRNARTIFVHHFCYNFYFKVSVCFVFTCSCCYCLTFLVSNKESARDVPCSLGGEKLNIITAIL